MCQETTARLPCTPSSVAVARAPVSAQLEAWGVTRADSAYDRVAEVELVISELVTNAVKFTTCELDLRVVAHRDHLEIAVSDDSALPAELKQPVPLTPGHRGLLVVDALAEHWGQRREIGTKTVWAQLSLPSGSALGRTCTLPTD